MSINFLKGHPSTRLLPVDQISEAFKSVLAKNYDWCDDVTNRNPLAYGTDSGNLGVRTTIAKWNNRVFGFAESKPENINLTAGASYGISNILNSATDNELTKRIFVVTPTYFLINSVFVDLGFEGKMTAIEETPNCEYEIDLAALEDNLKKYSQGLEESNEHNEINILKDPLRGSRKVYRFVMYLVPTFSNPGGLTYSIKTRNKLVELARKYDLLLISDDVYDLLNYTDAPAVPRINYLDQATITSAKQYGNTISNATFSKIIAPGLRTGWQETATPHLVKQLAASGANKSGGSPSQLNSQIVAELIETGELDRIVAKLCKVYAERANTLITSAKKYLPPSTTIFGGEGGYFLWITINGGPGFNHSEIVNKIKDEHNVILADGNLFDVLGDPRGWGKTSVRVCISYLEAEKIEEGIRLWSEVLRKGCPHLYQ